jgi:hypothetical protein
MGTDIHGTIEVLTEHYDMVEWKVMATIGDFSLRSYGLFSYLFGVRGSCQTNCANRGFPPRASWSTRDAYKRGSNDNTWHSLTYITWNELKPHMEKVRSIIQANAEWNEEWTLIFDLIEWLANRINTSMLAGGEHDTSRVRLVVWFDN